MGMGKDLHGGLGVDKADALTQVVGWDDLRERKLG